VVDIPPLRDRAGDAVLLSHAFLRRFSSEQRRPILRLADDAIRAVEAHRWPGNVRELQNVMKRASIMADGDRITADDLNLPVPAGGDAPADAADLDLRTVRERAERQAVVAALARTDGNIAKAADLLGVSRPTLYDLMARLGVKA
jgi:two-component system NtrC family response regulator